MAAIRMTTAFDCSSIPLLDHKFNSLQLRRAKCFNLRPCKRINVPNAVENNPETAEKESSSSIAAPRSLSSLITASNIRKALDGIEVVSVDHYARLGIPRGCSFAEVNEAFKRKCQGLMQQELDEEKVQSELQDLKESYEILASEEERRFYDWSLARAENQERYVWPYEVDITQRSSALGPPKVEDDPRPTAYVGYFFLGWLLLAFTLSITLK